MTFSLLYFRFVYNAILLAPDKLKATTTTKIMTQNKTYILFSIVSLVLSISLILSYTSIKGIYLLTPLPQIHINPIA